MPETRNVAPLSVLATGRFDRDGRVAGIRPSEQYLSAALQQAWEEHGRQRALDQKVTELIDDRHDLGLPEVGLESEEVRLGSAMDLVTRIRQWWPRPPVLRVPAMGVGDDPEGFSNDLEKGINALLAALSRARRGPRSSFFSAVKTDVIAYGRGFGALLPNPRAYSDYPVPDPDDLRDPDRAREYARKQEQYSKGRQLPLILRHLPARRVLPLFDDDGLCEVFWTTTERVSSVLERAKARGVSPSRTSTWVTSDWSQRANLPVTVVHYANRTYCAELIGMPHSFPPSSMNPDWREDCELLGDPYPHWLENRVPVAYFPGLTTPLDEEHLQTVSVTYGARNVILMLDRLASMKATVARTWAWPTPVLKTSLMNAGMIEAGEDGRPRPVEIAPGLMMTLWPDEDVSFLTYDRGGPTDGDELLSQLQQRFHQIGLPPVEAGQGDLSGYAASVMRSAAQGKYGAIREGMEQGWEDLGWIAASYLAQMPGPVYVPTVAQLGWASLGRTASGATSSKMAYLKLDPKKIRERNFQLTATMEMDRSTDMVANAQTAIALLQAGVSKRRVFENTLGIEDTTEERMQKLLEDFQDSDGYRQAAFGDALKTGQIVVQPPLGQPPAGALTLGDLSQFTPGQVAAFAQAGMIDQATFQQYMQMQAGNIPMGQVGGAMASGGAPPPMSLMGGSGMMGSPNTTPMGGAMPATMAPPAGALGAMGGASSPRSFAPAVPMPRQARGSGRAAGQSRAPARRPGGY